MTNNNCNPLIPFKNANTKRKKTLDKEKLQKFSTFPPQRHPENELERFSKKNQRKKKANNSNKIKIKEDKNEM